MSRCGVRWGGVCAVLVCVGLVSGCVRVMDESGEVRVVLKGEVRDAAGMSRSEVEGMSLEEQYVLFGERYDKSQDLLADAQRQVSTDEWGYVGRGLAPGNGLFAPSGALPGAGGEDSYYLDAGRSIHPVGARGERADLDPVIAYFEAQGWAYEINPVAEFYYEVYADVGDGYSLEYWVQPNGWYAMTVSAGPFWGSDRDITIEINKRLPEGAFKDELTVPGVRLPYPAWDAPIVNPRK